MKRIFLLFFLCSFNNLLFAQVKPQVNIGILLDNLSSDVEPIILSLQNEIRAVVGEDATVHFLPYNLESNSFNADKVKSNYDALINGNADIILAFGTVSNLIVGKQPIHKKPTILFGVVNSDIIAFDKVHSVSKINNFNFLITSQSYTKDLQTFKGLFNFKNVAVLVEDFSPNIASIKQILDKEVASLGVSYTLIPFKNLNDIKHNLEGVDAVYLAGGFHLSDDDIRDLSDFLITKKLPSFTATNIQDVVSGIMATNQTDENSDRFFRRIALNVEAIINGENPADLPIYIDLNNKLTVNYNTAKHIGVPIKYSAIATTNFVGDYDKVPSKRKYNLLDVINETVENNLSLQSGKKNVALKTQDIKIAKSNYYPEITASATGSYLDPKLAELSGGQNPEYKTSGSIVLKQTALKHLLQ